MQRIFFVKQLRRTFYGVIFFMPNSSVFFPCHSDVKNPLFIICDNTQNRHRITYVLHLKFLGCINSQSFILISQLFGYSFPHTFVYLRVAIHYSRITTKQIFRQKNVFQGNQSMNNEQPSTHYSLFLPNASDVRPRGVQRLPVPHEAGRQPRAPTAIQEGEMMTPGTPCSSVRHFDCTGRRR